MGNADSNPSSTAAPGEVYIEKDHDIEAYNVVHVTDNVINRLGW